MKESFTYFYVKTYLIHRATISPALGNHLFEAREVSKRVPFLIYTKTQKNLSQF
jgi:hypothetical protein